MRLGVKLLLGAFLAAVPLLPAAADSPPFPLGPALPIGGPGTWSPAAAANAEGASAVGWGYTGSKPQEDTAIGARLYDAAGQPVADLAVAASADAAAPVLHPSVAIAPDGSAVVTWTANDTLAEGEVFARIFDAAGAPAGDAFRISQTKAGRQSQAQAARTAGGGFVAVWAGMPSDGSGSAVYGRLFDAAGQPLGGEVQLNTSIQGNQTAPVVSVLGNGFVAAWYDIGGGGMPRGIFAQRLNAELGKVGPEIVVPDLVLSPGIFPDLAVSQDPEQPIFAIAWCGPASTEFGIRVQRFDQDGAPLGEPELASGLLRNQLRPSLIFDGAGGLVVSWTDQSQSGPGVVRARRLSTMPGPPLSPIFEIAPSAFRSSLAPLADGDFLAAFEEWPTDRVYGRRFSATLIFADGFEIGLTSAWSDTFPHP